MDGFESFTSTRSCMSFNTTTPPLSSFWPPNIGDARTVSTMALSLILVVFYFVLFPGRKGGIRELKGISIVSAWQFFEHRYDFMTSNFSKTTEPHFRFKVLQHPVIAVRGEDARKAFFDSKGLDFIEGYKILMGGTPRLDDIDMTHDNVDNGSWFNKQLAILFNKDRLNNILPSLFEDINRRTISWGTEGIIDPFKNIYDLVFQMTVRLASCKELSDDLESITRMQHVYWRVVKSSTPTSLLLPWFPGPAKREKKAATQELFALILDFVNKRKNASVASDDAIDVLIANGQSDNGIVSFIMILMFAGLLNTGINSCWILVYLAFNQQWKLRVKAEVEALIAKHTDTTSSEPLHKRLSAVPLRVWEEEMPVVELVIKETLRMILNGTSLRRNLLEDIDIVGGTVSRGDFVAYPARDVHLNPKIYQNPTKWDPDRFAPGREEGKGETYAFLGWGAGRHPCTGMKTAKLEMKIIVALFVAGYDYDVVDKSGNYPQSIPHPDYNDIHFVRPLGEPCFLKFKRVVE